MNTFNFISPVFMDDYKDLQTKSQVSSNGSLQMP